MSSYMPTVRLSIDETVTLGRNRDYYYSGQWEREGLYIMYMKAFNSNFVSVLWNLSFARLLQFPTL